jgi:hypothetical protein
MVNKFVANLLPGTYDVRQWCPTFLSIEQIVEKKKSWRANFQFENNKYEHNFTF